jgi:glycosyltransferase involved in cell wall biosynthesis
MTMIPSNSTELPHTINTSSTLPNIKQSRLLWANSYSLFDTSSGASRSARQMLLQLVSSGYHVEIVSAANFDVPHGIAALKPYWSTIQKHQGRFLILEDGPLKHHTMITAGTCRDHMTCAEEAHWFSVYCHFLESFRPHIVFYYGGKPLDMLVASEARYHQIATAFYLVNGNYTKNRWARDLDLILTDSHATATLYKQRLDIDVTPVGTFIDPATIVAPRRHPQRLLFINPNYSKGAAIVVRLAQLLEYRRPDIEFEVVQSRGDWEQIVREVSVTTNRPVTPLNNVHITATTNDMRPIYARAKILLVPSLWWDSGPRVIPEALLNGIPVIATASGGIPEILHDGGVIFPLDSKYHETPYQKIPSDEELQPMVQQIESLYDDENSYQTLVQKALEVGRTHHDITRNTKRLLTALEPWVNRT